MLLLFAMKPYFYCNDIGFYFFFQSWTMCNSGMNNSRQHERPISTAAQHDLRHTYPTIQTPVPPIQITHLCHPLQLLHTQVQVLLRFETNQEVLVPTISIIITKLKVLASLHQYTLILQLCKKCREDLNLFTTTNP